MNIDESSPAKSVFKDLDQYEVDQIWAEAVKLFKAGETLYLTPELEQMAYAKQAEHSETDDRTGIITGYLDTLLPTNWDGLDYFQRRSFMDGDELSEKGTVQRQRICVAELWVELFGKQKADMNKYNTKDLHTIMRSIEGWEEYKFPVIVKGYGRQRVYKRVEIGQNGIHEKKGSSLHGIHEVYTRLN